MLPDHRDLGPVALTIGVLDGVHRGHAALLRRTAGEARRLGGRAVALTLDPHPRCVLDPEHCPAVITSLRERRDLAHLRGADRLVPLHFTAEVSRLSAEDFCAELCRAFDLRRLVIGPDFALGHRRRGDAEFLRAYGRDHGFTVTVVGPVLSGGAPVSSTRVRAALERGRLAEAGRLLGHPYILDGVVVHGEGVGHRLGFPTANLDVNGHRCLPAVGVYCGWAHVQGAWYRGAASVGYRPTFGGTRLTVEWHLLDFDDDIYDEWVRAVFTHRLRDEVAYAGEPALISQIGRDVRVTRRRMADAAPPAELAPGAPS